MVNWCWRFGLFDVVVVCGDVLVIEDCKCFIEEIIFCFGRCELFLGFDNRYFFFF